MRRHDRLPLLLLCLLVCACTVSVDGDSATATTTDPEADRRAVIAAHEKLIRAYDDGNADDFVAMLDPSPELLIFHPAVENRFDGIDEAREGFVRMFARLGKATWTDVHTDVQVDGDVAWLTSHVLVESKAVTFAGRGTEVWRRTPLGWRLTHGHWSHSPTM